MGRSGRASGRTGERFPLAGLRTVITGASSGVGRATAVAVAAQGGVPILVARRADELEQARAEIEAAGGEAHAHACDLTDGPAVDDLVARLTTDHDRIDLLVNNAGRSIRRPIRESLDRFHDYERTIDVNYLAPVRLTLGLLPGMLDRGSGHVANVSSVAALVHQPRFSAYIGSKSALNAFTQVAANELRGSGVTFTTVHLSLVRTAMSAPSGRYDAFPMLTPEQAAELVVRALVDRPLHVRSLGWRFGALAGVVAPTLTDKLIRAGERKVRGGT